MTKSPPFLNMMVSPKKLTYSQLLSMVVGFVQVWLSRAELGTLYWTFSTYIVNYEIQQAHFQKCSMFTKLSKECCYLHESSALGLSDILAQSSVKIRYLAKQDFSASICNPRRIFPEIFDQRFREIQYVVSALP